MSNENVNKQDDKIWDELKELKDYEFLAENLLSYCKQGNVTWARLAAKDILKYISNSSLKEKDIYKRVIKEEEKSTTTEVKEFVMTSSGFFSTSEIYNRLQLTSRQERKNVVLALLRLKDEGIVERHPKKNGWYRRIDRELLKMDWRSAVVNELPINWALDLNTLFATYHKNIIMIAGTPDGGKTAFLFDFIKRNQKIARKIFKKPIHLFNSEMSPQEMKKRLSLHEDIEIDEWDFEAYERNDHFEDVIVPDGCNIIDYLEMDEPFEIRKILRRIHDKLTTGICIIGLQKPFGRDMGFGKEWGMQIPRLYLSVEGGVAKILKCKNRKTKESPVGKILPFKLVKGWEFLPEGVWRRPDEDPFDEKIRGYK